jgi:hypothetical protein
VGVRVRRFEGDSADAGVDERGGHRGLHALLAVDGLFRGTFGGSGTITANAVSSGDTFTIPSGSLTLTLPVAS